MGKGTILRKKEHTIMYPMWSESWLRYVFTIENKLGERGVGAIRQG